MTKKRSDYLVKYIRGEVNIFNRMRGAEIEELCQFLVRPEENVRNFAKVCIERLRRGE